MTDRAYPTGPDAPRDTPQTPESIARAKAHQQAERAALEAATGLSIDDDGHIALPATVRRIP